MKTSAVSLKNHAGMKSRPVADGCSFSSISKNFIIQDVVVRPETRGFAFKGTCRPTVGLQEMGQNAG